MPYFENQGANLYFEECGRGRPLIFLHGAALDISQWRRQVEHFSEHYRVIALDLRGHGRSSLPSGEIPPDVFGQDVVALMDFLRIDRAMICGLSMGGFIALQLAINAKERVDCLVLIGAICTSRFNFYERVMLPLNLFFLRRMPMCFVAWSLSVAMGKAYEESRTHIRKVIGQLNHGVYNRIWSAVTKMECRDGLTEIACPTLILVGDHDSLAGRQQQYINDHVHNSRLVVIKNAHHVSNLDNPDQVEHEMDRFFGEIWEK